MFAKFGIENGVPEITSYIILSSQIISNSTDLKFVVPNPGRLEGIRTSNQKFLEMENIHYAYYPGATVNTLNTVTFKKIPFVSNRCHMEPMVLVCNLQTLHILLSFSCERSLILLSLPLAFK